MMDPRQLAMSLLQRNPQVANNPRYRDMLNVIQSGDAVRGEQIAENLCKSYGMSKEQAITQAKQFFKL